MKICLTGWNGTIGHAIYKTLAPSHTVLRLGRRPGSDILHDLSDAGEIRAIDGLDAIIHCAGVCNEDFQESSEYAWGKSRNALQLLLSLAARSQTSRFIYFSTSHVYGQQPGTVTENAVPTPLTEYARCHWEAEQSLRSRFSGSLTIFRPNVVFGMPAFWEGFRRTALIPFSFPFEAVQNGVITLRTPGTQQRSFCSSMDLARLVEDELIRPLVTETKTINPVGLIRLSVFDFAKACAREAERQLGRPCGVSVLKNAQSEEGFSLGSIWPQFPQEGIDAYLREMVAFAVAQTRSTP